MYVVTNGSHFLKTNAKLTSHINEAKKYPNYTLAEKAKVNMKRTFRKLGSWRVEEFTEDIQWKNDDYDRDVYVSQDKVTTIMEVNNIVNKSFALAEDISGAYKKMLSYKSFLETTISEKERVVQDILHFVEFYDLDIVNGYRIYKLLQEIRIERRNAKNELERVNRFLKADIGDMDSIIKDKEKKSYTPRVLMDLFKGKWKPHRERKKDEKDK